MCGTASIWAKLGLVSVVAALGLHTAGWVTEHWMIYHTRVLGTFWELNVGLWSQTSCVGDSCDNRAVQAPYETDSFVAVRVLVTIVFCLLLIAAVLFGVYVFLEKLRKNTLAFVLIGFCFLAGLSSMSATIVWLVTVPDPFTFSYSMGLVIIAFLLAFIAAVFLILDVNEPGKPYKGSDSDPVNPDALSERRSVVSPLSFRKDPAIDW